MKNAGIDVSKKTLDIAIEGENTTFGENNDKAGHQRLIDRFMRDGVTRIGLEASGNYEAAVVDALRKAGLIVFVLDPRQIHGFRKFCNAKAKTDRIDARIILAAVSLLRPDRPAPDARMASLAEDLTMIEQIGDDIARLKTRRERYESSANLQVIESRIKQLAKLKIKLTARLTKRLKAEPDLAERLELLQSIPTIGPATALTLVIRMPELGRLSREEAAALVGVAPYNQDSGASSQIRHIAGGRKRLRKIIFMAAFSGSQKHNPALRALYQRLVKAGKPHKVAVIACARKLIHFANAILARGTPWTEKPA
jgi:transposase